MMEILSLSIALLFAVIFLFGGRLVYRPDQKGRRRFLSFAAGIAVAYVFVDALPALGKMRDLVMQTPGDFRRLFPEYSVYLWAMAGFLIFFCLETMIVRRHPRQATEAGDPTAPPAWQAWLHIGGFAAYTWTLSYIMVDKRHSTLALCVYAVAMGMHIFPVACNLSRHYASVYNPRGAVLLALASLAGWVCGLVFEIPAPLLVNLIAVVVGGVIVNTAVTELPKEGEGRPVSFLTGALLYTALLLILSHFDKGGEL
jgi:uncharacterized protein YqgC (DUF456 family)